MRMCLLFALLLVAKPVHGRDKPPKQTGDTEVPGIPFDPQDVVRVEPMQPRRIDFDAAAMREMLKKQGLPEGVEPTVIREKPDEEKEPGRLRLEIFSQGEPAGARVSIVDMKGRPVGSLEGANWFWAEKSAEFSVLEGAFDIAVDGGLRAEPFQTVAIVKPHETTVVKAEMKGYGAVDNAGWSMMDPFVYTYLPRALPGVFSFATLREVQFAGSARGLASVGVAGAWNLRSEEGPPYTRLEDGEAMLRQALDATVGSQCRLFCAWTAEVSGHGRFFALEPQTPPPTARLLDDRPLHETFAAVRDRGGLTAWSYPTGLIRDVRTAATDQVAQDFVFQTVAGPLYDALDISRGKEDVELWHLLLNHGYRIPAVSGGPPQTVPRQADLPELGLYVETPRRGVDTAVLLEAVRTGRTIVSNGPFLHLFLDGVGAGFEIAPSEKPRQVLLEAFSCSDPEDSIGMLELIYNGKSVRRWTSGDEHAPISPKQKEIRIRYQAVFRDVGWIQARYRSTKDGLWAITNPLYIGFGRALQPPPARAHAHVTLVDKKSGKPLPGRVRAILRGTTIVEEIAKGPTVELTVPATAMLECSADGYRSRRVSLYADSAAAVMIDSLHRRHALRAAMMEWSTYEEMLSVFENLKMTVRLERE